jgi:hypothetical protein
VVENACAGRLREHYKGFYWLMKNYTPVIPKAELKHGAYYEGSCRNASVARWDGVVQLFTHWRTKFGRKFVETIHCPEDEQDFDVFIAKKVVDFGTEFIPLASEMKNELLAHH